MPVPGEIYRDGDYRFVALTWIDNTEGPSAEEIANARAIALVPELLTFVAQRAVDGDDEALGLLSRLEEAA